MRFRGALLWLVVLAGLASPALGQTRPAPDPRFQGAEAAFLALPEVDRKSIQDDLSWAAGFSGTTSGSFGPLTFRAITALQAALRVEPDGVLQPAQRKALADRARAARDAVGFRLLTDRASGSRIGVPTALLPKQGKAPSGAGRWQSADEKVTLDLRVGDPGDSIEGQFARLTAASPGRNVSYKFQRADMLVVAGETQAGKFYVRMNSGPAGLRGFALAYDKAQAARIDPLVVAIANSFEPFPSGPPPGPTQPLPSQPLASAPAAPQPKRGVAVRLAGSPNVVVALASLDGCAAPQIGGRPAQIVRRDEAAGLALLSGAAPGPAGLPALRTEPVADGEDAVAVAFVEGTLSAMPAQLFQQAGRPAARAPLQPGGAGAPVFDRQGRLAGIVIEEPKAGAGGVAAQRRYRLAAAAAVQALAGTQVQPVSAADLTTGRLVESARSLVLPLTCAP